MEIIFFKIKIFVISNNLELILFKDAKELSSILQNEIGFVENANVEKENSNCNKTIDYNAIIKTIQEINNLRDKSLKTLEMIENSIVEVCYIILHNFTKASVV